MVLISSKISLVTNIEPITDCSASILFGNFLNLSLQYLNCFPLRQFIGNNVNANLKNLVMKLYNY